MDYIHFKVEDFVADDRFINWVNNVCSPEEVEFWRVLVLSNPHLEPEIAQARVLVINLGRAERNINTVQPETVRGIWKSIITEINETDLSVTPVNTPRKFNVYQFLAPASVVVVMAAVIAYFFLIHRKQDLPDLYSYNRVLPGFIELANTSDSLIHVALSDGTTISLEKNSRIRYKNDYRSDSLRSVFLQGEAFFDVARNPQKPFIVHTRDLVTEVLGTSFNVKADQNGEKVFVTVKTGKVSVYKARAKHPGVDDKKEGVVLLPNQEVVYLTEEQMFEKKIVDLPQLVILNPVVDEFIFENAPINAVFTKLEEAYGVEILFDAETMKDCYITAPLGSEPLFEKVKVICQTIGASYEIIDARIVVTSTGCETVERSKSK